MCGINGLLFNSEKKNLSNLIAAMNDSIIHRGPDDDGNYQYQHKLAMGMRRLSIVDLQAGKQPITNSTGEITIVFNGEIYNFLELKKEQEDLGYKFKTKSDTEVILSLYETYGESCVERLNGMFAFSIHDTRNNTIFIARDRFGEKPLYYVKSEDVFLWASELKSVVKVCPQVKEVSLEALNLFFALTYIPAPHTIYKDVFKLKPGHFIKIDVDTLKFEIKAYWKLNIAKVDDQKIGYAEASKQLRDLFFDSVKHRMISDVPIGVFLSGGVDSTIIAAIMAKISSEKIKSFSVAFKDKRYDESERARMVAAHIGAEHHEYLLDYDDFRPYVDNLVLNYDEPFADSSCIPTYFISKMAAQEVKVVLTGDGGDEVFAGYNKYLSAGYRKKINKYLPSYIVKMLSSKWLDGLLRGRSSKSVLTKAKKMISALDNDILASHLNIIALGFADNELSKLIKPEFQRSYQSLLKAELTGLNNEADEVKQLRYIDQLISLEGDMLVKVDRASMLCSLECRAPFLDHRLMEANNSLPDDYLIKGNNKKRILKDTFEDLLPTDFFNSPKAGFEVPVGEWFRGSMRSEIIDTLSVENLASHQFLNTAYVTKLLNEHLSLKRDHTWKLWTVFCFQKWYLNHFTN